LIAIARRLDRFDGRSSFSTWAYRVAANACFDELRRKRRRPVPAEPLDRPSRTNVGEAAADRVDIDNALTQLPIEFRTAVVLRDLCGLAYDDIAAVLEIPVGTVRSRIARGRTLLVPLLAPGNQPGSFDRPTAAP